MPNGSESAGCGPHAADAPLPGEAPRRPGLQRESGFVSTCWRVNEPHAHASMTRGRFALRRHARSHTSRSRFGFLFFNLTRLFYSRVSFLQEKTQGQERRPQWRRTMAREMSLWWPEPPREEDLAAFPAPGKPPRPQARPVSHGEGCAPPRRTKGRDSSQRDFVIRKISRQQRRPDAWKITSGHSLTYSRPRVPCAKARTGLSRLSARLSALRGTNVKAKVG